MKEDDFSRRRRYAGSRYAFRTQAPADPCALFSAALDVEPGELLEREGKRRRKEK